MKKIILTVVSAVSFMAAGSVMAGDAAAGKAAFTAKGCMACHGPDGKSSIAMYPKLNGQHAVYLKKQLTDFKAGTRKDASMAPMVASLTPADIDNIAAYISGVK
jgi:cytochrome c553